MQIVCDSEAIYLCVDGSFPVEPRLTSFHSFFPFTYSQRERWENLPGVIQTGFPFCHQTNSVKVWKKTRQNKNKTKPVARVSQTIDQASSFLSCACMLKQNLTACMPLLTATSALGLGRRDSGSLRFCYRRSAVLVIVEPFNLAAIKLGDFLCKIILALFILANSNLTVPTQYRLQLVYYWYLHRLISRFGLACEIREIEGTQT